MRTLLIKPVTVVAMLIGCAPWMLAIAQNTNATNLYHRGLAATCANCHGTDGRGVPDGGIPLINQLTSDQILTRLIEYRSGAREGTIMPQLTKGYSEEQLEIIAKQLGKQQ
jgi:cytochrome subunit of sulfide dehydrogenase